jgi:hypothetical protein
MNVIHRQYYIGEFLNVKYRILLLKWVRVGLISKLNELREQHMRTTRRLKQCLALLVFDAQIIFTIFLAGLHVKSGLSGTVPSGQTLYAMLLFNSVNIFTV